LNAQNNQIISVYLAAVEYACQTLGFETAARHFDRLHRLAQFNSKEELESIIRGWRAPDALPLPPPDVVGPWGRGAQWGNAVRVESTGGIIWKLKCRCGKAFTRSTNDTVEERFRQCDSCILADELTATRQEVIARLEQTSTTILAWHKAHDNVVWKRVRKAQVARQLDENYARELHAMCWAKIAERAGSYQDMGHKPSAWIGTVASNAILDHFKVAIHREELAPTSRLIEGSRTDCTNPEALPAEPVRPKGAKPDSSDPNTTAGYARKETIEPAA
jgi:DNA-directed RNA polymerase specialized sigma24 family protein